MWWKERGLWFQPTGFESWLHHLFMSPVTLVNVYSLNLFHSLYHGKIPTHKKVVKSNKIYSQRASIGAKNW